MESYWDWHHAKSVLDWQVELGATEAILDAPVNRYELAEPTKPTPQPKAAKAQVKLADTNPIDVAAAAAKSAQTLDDLRAAVDAFDLCDLKRGARQMVFADGNPNARVMIINDGPNRDDDLAGRPCVGVEGQLFDKMFDAIGLSRDAVDAERAIYIANAIPWHLPKNRDPAAEDIAMMAPFLMRHIELASPDVIVAMGNISCQALLGQKGVTRLRGTWTKACGIDTMPILNPAFLMRNPVSKRETWADLLSIKKKLGL